MDPRNVIEELDAFMRVWDRRAKYHYNDRALVRRVAGLKVILEILKRQRMQDDILRTHRP